MSRLTIGSLFAGIGGFDLAAQWVGGFETRWFVEIDPYCQRVLKKHWPTVPCYGDVRALKPNDLEAVDVLCGGFPCQPVSRAGHRKRQSDERWLWPEYARLIRELRPRYVVVENVPGLFDGGISDVLSDLAALRYDAEWSLVSACAVGAPHARERVFLLAYPAAQRPVPRPESLQAQRLSRELGRTAWGDGVLGLDKPGTLGTHDGIPDYFHRNESLGNAIVPHNAVAIFYAIKEAENSSAGSALTP